MKKSKKTKGFCYYLTFFYYFCSDSLMFLENLTPQTCSALPYRQDSLRRTEGQKPRSGRVGSGSQDIKGVYKRFVSRRAEISQITVIRVLNLATVDVLGMCLYASPLPIWSTNSGFPHGLGYYIHIGVGSNVVCSKAIDNARASTRGTDNSDDSTLFCVKHRANTKKVRYEHIV